MLRDVPHFRKEPQTKQGSSYKRGPTSLLRRPRHATPFHVK